MKSHRKIALTYFKHSWPFWITMLASVGASVFYYRTYLPLPFVTDDYHFLGLRYWKPMAGYQIKLDTPSDFFALFSPYRGWFYRPLALLYFPAVKYVFGPDPFVFHLLNHVINGIGIGLMAWLLFRLTKSMTAGVLAGLFFLRWPAKDEAIWWVSCVTTLACAVFYLLTLHLWLSFRETGKRRYYAGALASFVAALLWKNDAFTLPVAILLLDLVCLKVGLSQWRKLTLNYSLPLALFAAYAWLEKTASAYYVSLEPRLNKPYGETLQDRLAIIPKFRNLVFDNMHQVFDARDFAYLWILAPLAMYFAWKASPEQRRAFVMFAVLSAVCIAGFSLMGGSHIVSERFAYTPILLSAIAAACVWPRSPSPVPALALASLILAHFTIQVYETAWTMMSYHSTYAALLYGLCGAYGYGLYRSGWSQTSQKLYGVIICAYFALPLVQRFGPHIAIAALVGVAVWHYRQNIEVPAKPQDQDSKLKTFMSPSKSFHTSAKASIE
jgi:hypothetical protein